MENQSLSVSKSNLWTEGKIYEVILTKLSVLGSRFRTYYDFGYVALDIIHVTALDSGEYTVRATNHLGTAHTSSCVRVSVQV